MRDTPNTHPQDISMSALVKELLESTASSVDDTKRALADSEKLLKKRVVASSKRSGAVPCPAEAGCEAPSLA